MNIELDEDTVEIIVATSLRQQIDELSDYIDMRYTGSMSSVMYSFDIEDDVKRVRKLIKALKVVYNFYSVPDKRI